MNTEEFRSQGKKVIDFICESRKNASEQRVIPGKECKVNNMKKLLPSEYTPYHTLAHFCGDHKILTANIYFFMMTRTSIDDVPLEGESFDKIFKDYQENVMPYFVHFNHPNFHAYFPSGDSYASLLGDMLSTASNQVGFSYVKAIGMLFRRLTLFK